LTQVWESYALLDPMQYRIAFSTGDRNLRKSGPQNPVFT
jgi:hypothetical protein